MTDDIRTQQKEAVAELNKILLGAKKGAMGPQPVVHLTPLGRLFKFDWHFYHEGYEPHNNVIFEDEFERNVDMLRSEVCIAGFTFSVNRDDVLDGEKRDGRVFFNSVVTLPNGKAVQVRMSMDLTLERKKSAA